MISDGTAQTSAARRAATNFSMASAIGTTAAAMAAALGYRLIFKVHAGRARIDHPLHQLESVQRAAEAGLAVGHDGSEPMNLACALAGLDLIGTRQRGVDGTHRGGNAVGWIQALIGIHLPGEISVGGDLPARNVNGLQSRLDLLHGLIAGQCAQRGNIGLGVQQVPQALGSKPRQRVLDLHRAAQADHVVGFIRTRNAAPSRIGLPGLLQARLRSFRDDTPRYLSIDLRK